MIAFDDGQLVDGIKDIILGVLKINQPYPLAAFHAVLPHRDWNTFGQHFMKGFIGLNKLGRVDAQYCLEGFPPR